MKKNLSTPDAVRSRLQANLAKRGYLLPQQGLMAVAMPELQDAYMVMYSALTLDQNHLTPLEREFVWLGILTAAGERIGTHHVKLFFDLGGTQADAEIVFRLVTLAMGASYSFQFIDEHWQTHFDKIPAVTAYREMTQQLLLGSQVALPLARLILLGIHTTFGHKWGIQQELEAGYDLGVDEGKMAEAICLPFWAAGVNRLIDASEIWLELMRSGRVKPSPPFEAWAKMDKQGAMPI